MTATVATETVAAVNRLTARWLATWGTSSGVLSGAGAWPLIALLAGSADAPADDELAGAAGIDAEHGIAAAREVMALLAETDGVDAAIGVWAQERARVHADWRESVGADTVGKLTGDPTTDQSVLDDWARLRTGGLIDQFPVELHPEILLVLATAIAMRTTWNRPFEPGAHTPRSGSWQGRRLSALTRSTTHVDDVRTAVTPAGELTVTTVAGSNGLDVSLVLGPDDATPGAVLPAAVDVITGSTPSTSGSALLESGTVTGPGLATVTAPKPSVQLTTVPFEVTSDHDLTAVSDVFGLRTVAAGDRGYFSRVADMDLYVSDARQSAMARFTATGFEAAAVTAVGMRATSLPARSAKALTATYDRPFGFVATHRASGLVLFAGWVSEPAEFSG